MSNVNSVTVRIKIGSAEVEATGPQKWVEKVIAKFITQIKKLGLNKYRSGERQ